MTSTPIPVLEVGQLVSGQVIAGVHLYDSVNRSGEVHTHVTLQNGGTGVVRSSRLQPPLRRLKVAAHRILASNSQPHPDQGWHRILDGLHRARSILATANIDLLVVQVDDSIDPSPGTPSSLFGVSPSNIDTAAAAAQATAAWRNDAVNLFFTDIGGTVAGNSGFPRGFGPAGRSEVVFVDAEPDPVSLASTIAHECGHYLGLLHTFDTANGTETGPGLTGWPQGWDRAPNAAVAGDLVTDTLPDPNSDLWAHLWYGPSSSAAYNAVARNLMTSQVYALPRDQITIGQGVRMHQAISLARTSAVESDALRDCVFRAAPCGSSPALWFTPLRIGSVNDIWGLDLTPGSIFLVYASQFTNAAVPGPCLIHLDIPTLVAGPYAFPSSRTHVFQWTLPANNAYLGLQFNFQGFATGGTGVSGLDFTNGVSVRVGQ